MGLVTAARIILDQIGVQTLIFKEIEELEEGSWRRKFYESLGAHFFNIGEDRAMYTHEVIVYGEAALPTRATPLRQYRFE